MSQVRLRQLTNRSQNNPGTPPVQTSSKAFCTKMIHGQSFWPQLQGGSRLGLSRQAKTFMEVMR